MRGGSYYIRCNWSISVDEQVSVYMFFCYPWKYWETMDTFDFLPYVSRKAFPVSKKNSSQLWLALLVVSPLSIPTRQSVLFWWYPFRVFVIEREGCLRFHVQKGSVMWRAKVFTVNSVNAGMIRYMFEWLLSECGQVITVFKCLQILFEFLHPIYQQTAGISKNNDPPSACGSGCAFVCVCMCVFAEVWSGCVY